MATTGVAGTVVLHIIGGTCVGKTTLVDALGTYPEIHTVQIGKMMRAKYPPEHFQGQAAPAHTQAEAWEMYTAGILAGVKAGKRRIVVDGQPRDRGTVKKILLHAIASGVLAEFVLLHADHEIRMERARVGRTGKELQLAFDRLRNDYETCYNTLAELSLLRCGLHTIDTSHMTPQEVQSHRCLWISG